MVVPAAMQIESAVDMLKDVRADVKTSQRLELLTAIGADTASRLGVTYPVLKDFLDGYELGLQTARVMMLGSAELAVKGVDLDRVL